MYAPTTAAALVAQGGFSYEPVPAPMPATTEEALLASDLTLIAGIGPKRAVALNDAGIYTYAALARADAAALATAVGAPLAQAQQWVTAARAIEAIEGEP